ncbi:MAG: hypothetical protein U0Y82_17085 [Thermoleophilia bacterium]
MRILAVCGLAAVVMTSSGCFGQMVTVVSQQKLIGPGRLGVIVCVSKQNSGCPSGGRTNTFPAPAAGIQVQVLVAILAPDSFTFPATVAPPPAGDPANWNWAGGTYTQSPSLAAEYTQVQPPDPGTHWTGYISQPIADFTPGAFYSGPIDFVRAAILDGTPAPTKFNGKVSLGAREVTDTLGADRPVICNASDGTICDDLNQANTDIAPRDLTLVQPSPVTAAPGTTAAVPVAANFAGLASADYAFALTATTSVPGATATVNVPTLTPPSDSTTSVTVSVPVPANTAPGTYTATLTATIGSTGESRFTTGTIIVPAPGVTATRHVPRVTLGAFPPLTAKAARKKGLPVTITTDTATGATLGITRSRRVRRGRRVVTLTTQIARRVLTLAPGTRTLRVKSARFRPGKVTVQVTGTGFSARGTATLG